MTANPVGTVDERGVFTVGGAGVFTREFTLEQVDGEWRITDPPDGLIILEPDFERLYDEVAAYFLDPTGQRVVPDPRYLIAGEAQPTALVQRLLDGPSAALAAGVENPLSGVAAAQRRHRRRPGRPSSTSPGCTTDPAPVLAEICAQLVWTLTQLDQPRIRSVEIRVDGEPVRLDGVPRRADQRRLGGLRPRRRPGRRRRPLPERRRAAHRDHAASRRPDRRARRPTASTSAAVSADPGQRGAVVPRRRAGRRLAARPCSPGPYDGELAPVLDSGTLSAPTVAATRLGGLGGAGRHVGGARAGRRVAPGGERAHARRARAGGGAPALARRRAGRARRRGAGRPRASTSGTVVRAEDGGVDLRDLRGIAPALSQVVDVAWRDSGSLLRPGRRRGRGRDRALPGRRRRLGAGRRADGRPAEPAAVDRRGPDPAAAGQRRARRSGSWPAAPG